VIEGPKDPSQNSKGMSEKETFQREQGLRPDGLPKRGKLVQFLSAGGDAPKGDGP